MGQHLSAPSWQHHPAFCLLQLQQAQAASPICLPLGRGSAPLHSTFCLPHLPLCLPSPPSSHPCFRDIHGLFSKHGCCLCLGMAHSPTVPLITDAPACTGHSPDASPIPIPRCPPPPPPRTLLLQLPPVGQTVGLITGWFPWAFCCLYARTAHAARTLHTRTARARAHARAHHADLLSPAT